MVCSPEVSRMNGLKSHGPITERGKAIASRNSTKHGLLAEKPPILASEDLETFQGLMQALVDDYQPQGAVEWHLVQTIAMCIQRQHRLWAAEAALGNDQLLPAVEKPYTDEKYPTLKQTEDNYNWSDCHPINLAKERKLLSWYVERHRQEDYPTERQSKYFNDIWQDWVDSNVRDLERLRDEYPTDGIPDKPNSLLVTIDQKRYSNRFHGWIRDLRDQGHPYAEAYFYQMSLEHSSIPKAKKKWEYYLLQHALTLDVFRKRVEQIGQIEQEIERERDRYQADLAERRILTASPIPSQIGLLSRYESHIAKQLKEAIAQLQALQKERKIKGSMGSFS